MNARKTLWEFQTDGNRQNGAAYTKSDGTPNYEVAFLGDFYDDMVVGVRYFGSTDGNIYALQ